MKSAATGSPVNPIISKMYMEHFEERALRTADNTLGYGEGM